MRTIYGSLVLGAIVVGCGGGGEGQKPVEAPPAPTVAPPAPTTTDSTPTTAVTPAKASMQDMQKALVGAVADSINAHDTAKFSANYADDATITIAGMPDPIKGKDAIAADEKKMNDGFPTGKLAFSRVWGKNDVVVCEWVVNATHTGDFMGVKATEKPVGYTGLSVVWVNADGKVKEEHRYVDFGTIMAQIGASKAKARAIPAMPTSTEWHWAKGDATEDKATDSVKAAYAAFEKKDDKAMGDMSADDIVWDDMVAPAPTKGKAEMLKQFKLFTTAFPDLKMTATNSLGVEDFAIAEVTTTGTPKGNFMGLVSQTKKPVTLHMVDVVQLKDGKALKGWTYGNSAELLVQFGLMKPPGAAAAKTDAAKPAAPKTDAAKPATPAPAPKK